MIGIDVGGANLKVVDEYGIHIHYCPLWQNAPIIEILSAYEGENAAVVMSGELADSFANKMEGIEYIVNAVREVFPSALFYGMDGAFHTGAVPHLAAANWLASADYLRTRYPDAVLLDMGSTTTDIIPLNAFDSLKGLTDTLRLQRGFLLYTGLLRTPVHFHLPSVRIDGVDTLSSSELFAISADAHLALGHIEEKDYTVPPPDGAGTALKAALTRLSRVVCADLGEIGTENAMGIAEQFWDAQCSYIRQWCNVVQSTSYAGSLIIAGIGADLLAREWRGINLHNVLGIGADALPAYAVREVALRKDGF
jgi:probable H4MPT-linked C1 transfer pathway protein